ncbi:MAG: hypothetical protein HKN80_01475 [Acidimicrobiia bacterium]|nr:hypothetical protein [Acidimicrobiia bacterium]NNC91140.1 hypothetical protein [Acidimicrobiia bacterium]
MIQKIGFSLVAIGLLVLVGWSVQGFFLESEIPLFVRISVGAIGAGLLLLLGSVVRDRIAAARTEDFKEIQP